MPKKLSIFHRPARLSSPGTANPRVFLSHSGNEGAVKQVLDCLVSKLEDAGFEPLLDRQIMLGTNYHPPLDEWLATCDAAVFVISPRALEPEHSWVRDEANQLRYKLIQPAFQGIPVLIEGVTPAALGESWEATGLRLQNAIVDDDPSAIADKVVEGLGPTCERVRAAPVAKALERFLRSVGSEDALRYAAQPLDEGYLPTPVALHLAQRLLGARPFQVLEVAERLALESDSAANAVLRLALPFTWVDRNAALALAAAMQSNRPAALNAAEIYTTQCYVVCGLSEYPPWPIYPLRSLQGEYLGELSDEAARARDWTAGGLEEPHRPAPSSTPVVYAVDCRRLTEDVVEFFDVKYGGTTNVGIVFLAHGQRWADTPEAIAEKVALVTPELDPALEKEARQFYDESLIRLNRIREREAEFMARTLS